MATATSNTPLARNALFWLSFAVVSYGITRSLFWHSQDALYQHRVNKLSFPEASPQLNVPERNGANENEDNDDEDDRLSADGKPEARSQGSEDDLSIETLDTLAQHPNYDIRQSARTVLFYRFANSKECCAQLRNDLRDADKRDEATAVMRSLVTKVDLATLLGPTFLTLSDPTDLENILDGFLSAGVAGSSARPAARRERMLEQRGPMVTLEEVEGEDGGIVSVRVPSLGTALDGQIGGGDVDDLDLRRWQRREAMVVQLDAVEEDEYWDEAELEYDIFEPDQR